MDFVQYYFGKEANKISEQNIIDLAQNLPGERNNIELKSASDNIDAQLRDSVLNTIAAFLNADGGLLIWGAPREIGDNTGQRKYQSALNPVNKQYSRDRLVSIISGNIDYYPVGITVDIVSVGNGWVYLVQAQKSANPPHQSNGRYWIRIDGATVSAPHYLLDAMFKSVQFPKLSATVGIQISRKNDSYVLFKLLTTVTNESPLINEEGITRIAEVSEGEVYRRKYIAGMELNASSQLVDSDSRFILHHGTNFSHTYLWRIPLKGFEQDWPKFSLLFGGRKSPLRVTTISPNMNLVLGHTRPPTPFHKLVEYDVLLPESSVVNKPASDML